MSSRRKIILRIIFLTLLVCTFVFWGTAGGGICLFTLIQGFLIYISRDYASKELAKQFEETGENVKGWRG